MYTAKLLCTIGLYFMLSYGIPANAKEMTSTLAEERRTERVNDKKNERGLESLREYGFWSRATRFGLKNEPGLDNAIYNTTLYAWFETNNINDVESYAFVQYMRGCVFLSALDEEGVEVRGHSVVHQHGGKRVVFVHPSWVIDSDDESPIYGSNTDKPLVPQFYMQWGNNPSKFPEGVQKYYGDDPPSVPRLHVRSNASTSAHTSAEGTEAINHSLEFKMCLYRTKDALEANRTGVFIENPIDCFTWGSSFVYDFKEKKFNSPHGIEPVCRPEIVPSAEKPWELKR